MQAKVELDRQSLARFGEALRRRAAAMPRAMAAAVDEALGDLSQSLRAERPGPPAVVTLARANVGRVIQGEVDAHPVRVPLKLLGARQVDGGVVYQLGGRQRFVAHAFGPNIARLGSNVFLRRGPKRLPLRQVYAYLPALRHDAAARQGAAERLARASAQHATAALVGKETS